FILDRIEIDAREALDGVKLFCMRQTSAIDPEVFAEAFRIDNQRVFLPMSDGVAIRRGIDFLGMRAAIHIDHAKSVRTADIEDIDALEIRHVHEVDPIWSLKLTRQSGWMTTRVGFEFVDLAVVVKRLGPRLKWDRFDGSQR